ncbi:MAG: ATP-binding cassette domain-containing protein [Lachnospiraceae bacterium]|nr:ATP-binding cassette domain-containing protein [Lachnospiraceae bacterium]
MEYVLTTKSLCKKYKDFKALDHLDMHVPKGSIYGFVGKNGAGKTTLIRLITGLQYPTEGEYLLYDTDSRDPKINKVRRRMGAVVETPSLYLNLSAVDNLKQQYGILGLPDYSGLQELLKLVGLEDTGKRKVKDFSLGMRQRLGIAVALVGRPDFLVLDEPINGLDPQGIIEIRELILKLNREYGITVLISSHILDELSRLATHYGFIDHGRMVKEISEAELSAACRKKIRVKVSDLAAFSRVLEMLKLRYEIVSDSEADIYDEIAVTDLVNEANTVNCRILTVKDQDESLESFYLNLVGGGADHD